MNCNEKYDCMYCILVPQHTVGGHLLYFCAIALKSSEMANSANLRYLKVGTVQYKEVWVGRQVGLYPPQSTHGLTAMQCVG